MIDEAARMLLAAAPGSLVILFGSQARGDADAGSDVDFLVVERRVSHRHAEMVRLAEVIRPLRLPADVVVASADQFDYWRDTPNSLFHRAAREGKVYGQGT